MCFDFDSRPPIAPIEGGAIDSGEVTLTSTDGTPFTAFRARSANPTGAGMIVLPDVRGLHPYYEELALRFAEHGIDAVAIDYFARTAGLGRRDAAFEYQPHVPETRYETLANDVRAAAAFLRSPDGGGVTSVFTMGFCFGGRLAFLTATLDIAAAGVVGFYGWPVGPHRNGSPAPVDVVAQMTAPVLGVFAGADQGIPVSAAEEFEVALRRAGVEHTITTYEGAPHSFFDRKAEEFADASARAWTQVLEFVRARAA